MAAITTPFCLSLSTIPPEIRYRIIETLDRSSFLHFRSTSIENRDTFSERFERIKRKVFEHAYGKITSFDLKDGLEHSYNSIYSVLRYRHLIHELYRPIHKKVKNLETLYQQYKCQKVDPKVLSIDKKKNVVFIPPEDFLEGIHSFWQRYNFYKGTGHIVIRQSVEHILQRAKEVFCELKDVVLDTERPIQDLRNRIKRNEVEKQITNDIIDSVQISELYCDYFHQQIMPQLSFFERRTFKMLAAVQALFEKIFTTTESSLSYFEPDSFDHLMKAHPIVLCNTTIKIQNRNVAIAVGAIFTCTNHKKSFSKGITIFYVTRRYSHDTPGNLLIKRCWYSQKAKGLVDESDVPEFSDLEARRLHIELVDEDVRDACTGDYPVKRFLIQLAIEIFLLESEEVCLEITASAIDAGVVMAAGFFCLENDDAIQASLVQTRASKKLFPENAGEGKKYTFRILKKMKEDGSVELIQLKENEEKTALVDWSFPSLPITWQEYIKNNRILKNQKVPLLPEFLIHNHKSTLDIFKKVKYQDKATL